MANTNIMTGYTYILVIVFLQLLLGLSCPVVWAKALASSGMAMLLQIQCHTHKSITYHHACSLCLTNQILLPTPLLGTTRIYQRLLETIRNYQRDYQRLSEVTRDNQRLSDTIRNY